jgi:hypothetical protein
MNSLVNRLNWKQILAKRVYCGLIVLIILAIFHIVDVMTSNNRKLIIQLEQSSIKIPITHISPNFGLISQYELQVDSPNWFYSLLIKNNIGLSPITTIVTLIIASLGFFLHGEVELKNPFRKNLTKPILFAAYTSLLLFILEFIAYHSLSLSIDLKQINGYQIARIDNYWMCFTSIGLFWLANIMKKGYHLQYEQNLTI